MKRRKAPTDEMTISTIPKNRLSEYYSAAVGTPRKYWRILKSDPERYVRIFERFDSASENKAKYPPITWNWTAFIFNVTWMLYRKMYLQALFTTGLLLTPWVGTVTLVLIGLGADRLYHRQVRKLISKALVKAPRRETRAYILERGGVSDFIVFWSMFSVIVILAAAVTIAMIFAFNR
jgi:hypothetical protein